MSDNRDFTQGSIIRKLTRFMLPLLAALALQSMYTAVDLLVVGRLGSNEGISGVTTGSEIIVCITFVVSALATGVTVLLGQYLGAKQNERNNELIGNATCFFLIMSVAMSALIAVFAPQIAYIMGAPEEAFDETSEYIRICGGGYVFVVFYNYISSIFRGIGDSKMPLIFVAIACGVNILGDVALVPVLDVAGAAIATVAAQAISVVFSIVYIKKANTGFALKREYFRFGKETKKFIKIGLPVAAQELLTNVTFLALMRFMNDIGLDASSGYGISVRLQYFIMLIPSALIQGVAPFVAQNVGAGDEKRAKKTLYCGISIGAALGVAAALITIIWGRELSAIFSTNTDFVDRSYEFLIGFAPEAVMTAILFSFLGYFSGLGKTNFVFIQGLIQSFLIRLPVSYIMSKQPNPNLAYVALVLPLSSTVGIIMCVGYYFYLNRKKVMS